MLASTSSSHAASSTTCLCRSDDGKSFKETIRRHHRWGCDYHLGYIKGQNNAVKGKLRPATQTCNKEEVIQFKVYLCMAGGCAYPYSAGAKDKNKALEKIQVLKGKRQS